MKLVKNLVLLGIMLVLAAWVYFYEIKGGEEREQQKQYEEKIFHFETDSVRQVEIFSRRGNFVFERVDKKWRIKIPVQTGGDQSTINGMLNTLKNLKKIRTFHVTKNDLKNYGLSGKPLKVRLTLSDGTVDSLLFGENTPVGSNLFCNQVDTLVYTIASYTKSSVDKKLFDWRDKSVSDVKASDIKEFQLVNNHGTFSLERRGGDWYLTRPGEFRADNGIVSRIVNKIENVRIKSVENETFSNPRKYGLNRPAYKLDLYIGESKARKSLIFSKRDGNRIYGKDDARPYVFTVDTLFIKDLEKNLDDLRYKKFAEFNKSEADSMVVFQGDSSIVLVKDTSDTWVRLDGAKVKETKINSFINSLQQLKAKHFLQDNVKQTVRHGLRKPIRTVAVYGKDKELCYVKFGDKRDKNRVAFNETNGMVVEITDLDFSRIVLKAKEYLEEDKREMS